LERLPEAGGEDYAIYSRRQKAQGFYVYYFYVVISAVRSVLTLMATAIHRENLASSGGEFRAESLVPSR
jgi:hypothetical protein